MRRLALLALALAPLAGAQGPLGQGDLAAILWALGIREQPPDLTTVRLWWDGNGGYVDLPPRSVKHVRTDEAHRVEWLGPPKDRDPEYIRDREFDHLVQLGSAS